MQKFNIKETSLNFIDSSLVPRCNTDMIVIHHTGSVEDTDVSAAQIHQWHLNQGWAGIGYHFVIRKDGTIERGRPEDTIGAHAFGENYHSIGIQLSGDFNTGKPTFNQIESTAILIAYLCGKYSIECNREHIVGHCDLMSTDCPGNHLYLQIDDIIGKANWYYQFDS